MPRSGDNIKIPLSEREAVRLLMQVKPTAEMPRQGAVKKPKAKVKKKAAEVNRARQMSTPVTTAVPEGMTSDGYEWRREAERCGCKLYYASEPGSSSMVWGFQPDEHAFQRDRHEHPDWFLLNDARAYTSKYPLMLHHCSCWRLRGATTLNWPKLISEKRESLEHWARENRPDNPVLTCSTCIG